MVGNSEAGDIQPAVGLAMRAIRVAIEEPPPASSAAHAVASNLAEVLGCVRRWVATDERRPETTD
jgi:FMN phosphatase YigB (HAD superfamily)